MPLFTFPVFPLLRVRPDVRDGGNDLSEPDRAMPTSLRASSKQLQVPPRAIGILMALGARLCQVSGVEQPLPHVYRRTWRISCTPEVNKSLKS